MDPRHIFVDERLNVAGYCVYCGAKSESQDHCPSKVLLDEPYPLNLPVVEACVDCNNKFSLDEQYVACLIEAVICGSTRPEDVTRENIKRILADTPRLAGRIERSKQFDESGNAVWNVDIERVQRVVLKLARAHIADQISLTRTENPDRVSIIPLILMSEEQRSEFESPEDGSLGCWPEVGTRSFIRAAKSWPSLQWTGWVVVQPGRYRYLVRQSDGVFVSLVLSEYLACHVAWHDE